MWIVFCMNFEMLYFQRNKASYKKPATVLSKGWCKYRSLRRLWNQYERSEEFQGTVKIPGVYQSLDGFASSMLAWDRTEKNLHQDFLTEKNVKCRIASTFEIAVVLLHHLDGGTAETTALLSSIALKLMSLLDFLYPCSSSGLLAKTL